MLTVKHSGAGPGSQAHLELDLVRRALAREGQAFRTIMRTHNRRLFRIARSIVRNDSEAEDVVQEAYMRAFQHLESFRGEASLGTWLARIVMNEALGRLRKHLATTRAEGANGSGGAEIIDFPLNTSTDDPERTMAQREILRLVEQATDELPEVYRTVFVARVIEGMSVEETADLLGVRPETVKTRLHRARNLLRAHIEGQIGPVLLDAFPFAGRRCERLTEAVMRRLALAE